MAKRTKRVRKSPPRVLWSVVCLTDDGLYQGTYYNTKLDALGAAMTWLVHGKTWVAEYRLERADVVRVEA